MRRTPRAAASRGASMIGVQPTMSLARNERIFQRQELTVSPMRPRALGEIAAGQRLCRGPEVKLHIQDSLVRSAARAGVGLALLVGRPALNADELGYERH